MVCAASARVKEHDSREDPVLMRTLIALFAAATVAARSESAAAVFVWRVQVGGAATVCAHAPRIKHRYAYRRPGGVLAGGWGVGRDSFYP